MKTLAYKLSFWLCFLFLPLLLWSQAITDSAVYTVTQLPFNTKDAEFSPFLYKSGIAFVSNRKANYAVVYESEETEQALSDIYYAEKQGTRWGKPTPLNKNINSIYSEGPFSITKDTARIYFTRNDVRGENSKLNIYQSDRGENGWQAPSLLAINQDKYSFGHPAIAPSGNFMVFCSNMPGGYGGTDLYITYNKEGKWTKPKNMGPKINTGKNEITPFILENNILFYASNGQKFGLGGYDIYSAVYNQFEWQNSKMLPYPINTAFNDFGLIFNSSLTEGYFSSNRTRGGDDDDLFYFEKRTQELTFCDTLKEQSMCRTFFEESSIGTDDNSPLIYQWDFGDGNKRKGNEVRYCYSKPGTYTVQLNIVDIISDQVFLNEATYTLDIQSVGGLKFSIPDTVLIGKEYTLIASNTESMTALERKYTWDLGQGASLFGDKVNYKFTNQGSFWVSLTEEITNTSVQKSSTCKMKQIKVVSKADYDRYKVREQTAMKQLTATAKAVYSIKDSDGNEYKIQIATSPVSVKHKFKKLEGVLKIDEYYDRDVYGYTIGSFSQSLDAYPTLKKIRKIGFTEAVLIATKNGKVISGNDSSFYISIPEDFFAIRLITLKGKIVSKSGIKLPATLQYESLTTGDTLGSVKCQKPEGEFAITITDGDLYGYTSFLEGYFPASNYIDLRKENDYAELSVNIVMYKTSELAADSLPVKLTNVFFSPDKYEIQPESYPELDRLATYIQKNPNYKFEISGHTDHTGSAGYNMNLSEQRATAVKNYLVKRGCEPSILNTKGYGNTKPLTTNRGLIELNRRVEFKILGTN